MRASHVYAQRRHARRLRAAKRYARLEIAQRAAMAYAVSSPASSAAAKYIVCAECEYARSRGVLHDGRAKYAHEVPLLMPSSRGVACRYVSASAHECLSVSPSSFLTRPHLQSPSS